jgi:hypothetical protein
MRCWQDPPGLLSLTKAFLPLRADRGPTVPTDTKTETAWAFLPPQVPAGLALLRPRPGGAQRPDHRRAPPPRFPLQEGPALEAG